MATLSDALREAYASADPAVVILHTIDLWHPTWSDHIRLVQGFDNITAVIEDGVSPFDGSLIPGAPVLFTACPFAFVLPQVGEGRQELQVQIENVGLALMPVIEAIDLGNGTPATITYRPYLSSDLSIPHMNPPLVLDLVAISVTSKQVACTCAHANWSNRKFPGKIYRVEDFPGVAPRV